MNKTACIAAIAILAATGACKRVESAKVDEATMTKASDAMISTVLSGDVSKVDALYAKDIIAVDPIAADFATDSDGIHKFNQGFMDMKVDKLAFTERHFQALDDEDFIVTAKLHMESSAGPVKAADFRVTDSFRKQPDGKFLIVNEHVSFAAPAPAAPAAPATAAAK